MFLRRIDTAEFLVVLGFDPFVVDEKPGIDGDFTPVRDLDGNCWG